MLFNDFFLSEILVLFFWFLLVYYFLFELIVEECDVLELKDKLFVYVKMKIEVEFEEIKRFIYGDYIVVKWFVSIWMMVEFVIDLIYWFGVIVVGLFVF